MGGSPLTAHLENSDDSCTSSLGGQAEDQRRPAPEGSSDKEGRGHSWCQERAWERGGWGQRRVKVSSSGLILRTGPLARVCFYRVHVGRLTRFHPEPDTPWEAE